MLKEKRSNTLLTEDYLALLNAPPKLFHPYRLLIVQTLKLHGSVEFRQLRHSIPEITDGKLASHLNVLEKLKYVRYHKEIIDRKLRTSYEITEKGRADFEKLLISLKKMMKYE